MRSHAALRTLHALGLALPLLAGSAQHAAAQPAAAQPAAATLAATTAPAASHVAGRAVSTYDVNESGGSRAINVQLAAARLDGALIAPRRQLSFNTQVGPRTVAAGFAVAQEIADGRLVEGVGGGVCQVATALHLAALEAGLEITRGRPHSIPVPYAPPGLDAAVVDGRVDLRIRNPYSFPVRVVARAADGRLEVRLETPEPVSPTQVRAELVRTLRIRETTEEDARLRPGARRLREEGREGQVYRVRVEREGRVLSDRTVEYPARPRVFRVGPSA